MNKKIAGSLLLVAFAVSLAAPVMAALNAPLGCETPAPAPRPEPEVPQAP